MRNYFDYSQIADQAISSSPNRLAPEDRYQRDPMFRTLVDMMEQQIHLGNYTPTELREAAILAALIHESHTLRRYVLPNIENTLERP